MQSLEFGEGTVIGSAGFNAFQLMWSSTKNSVGGACGNVHTHMHRYMYCMEV